MKKKLMHRALKFRLMRCAPAFLYHRELKIERWFYSELWTDWNVNGPLILVEKT